MNRAIAATFLAAIRQFHSQTNHEDEISSNDAAGMSAFLEQCATLLCKHDPYDERCLDLELGQDYAHHRKRITRSANDSFNMASKHDGDNLQRQLAVRVNRARAEQRKISRINDLKQQALAINIPFVPVNDDGICNSWRLLRFLVNSVLQHGSFPVSDIADCVASSIESHISTEGQLLVHDMSAFASRSLQFLIDHSILAIDVSASL